MPRRRQLVLMNPSDGGPATLGALKDLRATLGRYNTGGDGTGPDAGGVEILHGPGFTCEVATAQPVVQQVLVSLLDEDIAWPVLSRLCKAEKWKMMDVETGRMFG
ncbi:MAG: hypothetical protein FJ255_03210 [Phycisphaerae bacterium]|nr:hypothetical protein [Phycisphaerae bacterium]